MADLSKKIVIIAAPSGAGKTSITKHLLQTFPAQLVFSISCATRPPRNKEKHGVDYYFISVDEFKRRVDNNEFAEWEMVYQDRYYGTLKVELERVWKHHKTPLLDVDVKGGLNIQHLYREHSLSLFILPPSLEELERRLKARGTESPESLKARLSKAAYELTFQDQFDHIILNDNLETACREAERIIRKFLDA
ncbi:MAG: guanylate kinase [Bacteroidetes bacterium]|nr:guanylate kinase [Bacteroidota bacterium]